jgi:hypothetical protein
MNKCRPLIPSPKAAAVAVGVAILASLLAGCSTLLKLQAKTQAPADAAEPVAAKPVKVEPVPDLEPPKKTKLYEWSGEGRAVTRIVVDVDEQKARFYEGDKEVGWATVASGVSKFPTPVGTFSVQEKVANKESNLYGKIYGQGGKLINSNAKVGQTPIPPGARFDGADMPYFLRLTGDGIGMHAGPIPKPGRPASHGCIRMPKGFAPIAFRHVPVGTPVSIVGNGPTYSAYLAQQRASAPRPKPATPAQVAGQTVAQTVGQVPDPGGDKPETAALAATPSPAAAAAGTPSPGIGGTPEVVPAPLLGASPDLTPGTDASKVAAVAREPIPPVARAIATRTEPPQAPVGVVQARAPLAVAPQGGARPDAVPAVLPVVAPAVTAPALSAPAGPTAVYYPAPQVPAYRAPAQAPVFLPLPAPPVALQAPAPVQAATPPAPVGEPEAADAPAAAAEPTAVESPGAPTGAPAAQGAG